MKKEEMGGLKKSSRAAVIITMLLVAAGLVWSVLAPFMTSDFSLIPTRITDIVMYLLVSYYGLWGYKKPHGNLLRYLMLLFGISLIPLILVSVPGSYISQILQIALSIAVLFIGYMSGRLCKIQKNRKIAIIVFAVFVLRLIMMPVLFPTVNDPIMLLGPLSQVILWLAVCVVYFTRYQLHKEAGLQDKPEKTRV